VYNKWGHKPPHIQDVWDRELCHKIQSRGHWKIKCETYYLLYLSNYVHQSRVFISLPSISLSLHDLSLEFIYVYNNP